MDYEIILSHEADHFLIKLSKKDKKTLIKLWQCIDEIKNNPYNSEQLKGYFKGARKKRKGSYRIIFDINNESFKIIILRIGKRETVYKR